MDIKADIHVENLKKLWKNRPGLFKSHYSTKTSLLQDNNATSVLRSDGHNMDSTLKPIR